MPSSVIARMIYEPNTLTVIYVSGAVYEYLDVPEEVYAAMKAAKSKGTFLNVEIKPKYAFKKIK